MKAVLDFSTINLFVLFVLPGLISMRMYRLIMPAESVQWGTALLEGLFYSSINYALFSPLIWFMHSGSFPSDHPILYAVFSIVILFVGPVSWPWCIRFAVRKTTWVRALQLPYPSAWDYYFDERHPAFVIIHLTNGNIVGGYYGPRSYATSYPNDGDIYLEAVYELDDDGTFVEPIPDTNGLLISKDAYHYVELFTSPERDALDKDHVS